MPKRRGQEEQPAELVLIPEQTKNGNGKKVVPALSGVPHVFVSDPDQVNLWPDLTRSRLVFVMVPIVEAAVQEATQTLIWLDQRSRRPITVFLSTPGGDIFSGLALFDVIRSMRAPTTTINLGCTASMGAILLQAGQRRLVARNSWLMMHEPLNVYPEGAETNAVRLQVEAKLMTRLQQQFLDILTERSKMKRKDLEDNWKQRDFWLNASEIVRFGFADGFFPEEKSGKKSKKG